MAIVLIVLGLASGAKATAGSRGASPSTVRANLTALGGHLQYSFSIPAHSAWRLSSRWTCTGLRTLPGAPGTTARDVIAIQAVTAGPYLNGPLFKAFETKGSYARRFGRGGAYILRVRARPSCLWSIQVTA